MKLLALHLENADAKVAEWLDALKGLCQSAEVIEPAEPNVARRAVWMGVPFVLVGRPCVLDPYLAGLDADESEILKDCAYFWLLTDREDYWHPRLPQDRHVVFSWHAPGQNVIRNVVQCLTAYPRLSGLSRRMHVIREEIRRISAGPVSPGYPVLIVGDSGVGKEEVAMSLFESSERGKRPAAERSGLHAMGGAWLRMEPGLALTELIGLAPNRSERGVGYPGLLKLFEHGGLFLDDFETAPLNVQETLLRIMSTKYGKPAIYRQVGGVKDDETLVWLLFATNTKLHGLSDGKKIREDFLYRFEDRVVTIPPLKDRPADFPAIARAVWDYLWEDGGGEVDVLRSSHLREIYKRRLNWEGNVRTLRALLALVVSMRRNPAHNHTSPGSAIETILSRGPTYLHWAGVLGTEYFITGHSIVEEIRKADEGFRYRGRGPTGGLDEEHLLPSERRAREVLTREGWEVFKKLVGRPPAAKNGRVVRVSVRLARIVWYVSQNVSINWRIARDLTEVRSEETAVRDIAALAHYDLKHPRKKEPLGPALLRESAEGSYVKAGEYFT